MVTVSKNIRSMYMLGYFTFLTFKKYNINP
jgi:hypothetical protein